MMGIPREPGGTLLDDDLLSRRRIGVMKRKIAMKRFIHGFEERILSTKLL